MPDYGEANDFYNLSDWSASSSTDSVYLGTGTQRQLKQASSTTNTFEKDQKGRVVKITRRFTNKTLYKVMQISY